MSFKEGGLLDILSDLLKFRSRLKLEFHGKYYFGNQYATGFHEGAYQCKQFIVMKPTIYVRHEHSTDP